MLRESPTLRSQGGTAITPVPTTGTYRIDSFFDIFTELSVDGGATWTPASSAPAHHELQSSAPEITESSPNLPPLGDEYVSPPSYRAMFGSSLIFREVKCDSFTQSQPPPPPGGTQVPQSNAVVHFRISTDGGKTYQPGAAPAAVTFRVSSTQDDGATRYFETEMLQLNISGGSLPAGMMLRESPSRQSLGRTSIRIAGTDFMTSSFFDIFTELSADGGQTWQPCSTGPMDLAVRHPIVIADSDSDGIPDSWMIANFGHAQGQAFDKSRATDDADGDGRTNLEEYLAGTDPRNRDSRLSATFARQAANGLVQFGAVTGRRYSVECKQDLQLLNPWQVICTDLQGAGPLGVIITNPFTVQHRFYRVRVEVIPP